MSRTNQYLEATVTRLHARTGCDSETVDALKHAACGDYTRTGQACANTFIAALRMLHENHGVPVIDRSDALDSSDALQVPGDVCVQADLLVVQSPRGMLGFYSVASRSHTMPPCMLVMPRRNSQFARFGICGSSITAETSRMVPRDTFDLLTGPDTYTRTLNANACSPDDFFGPYELNEYCVFTDATHRADPIMDFDDAREVRWDEPLFTAPYCEPGTDIEHDMAFTHALTATATVRRRRPTPHVIDIGPDSPLGEGTLVITPDPVGWVF